MNFLTLDKIFVLDKFKIVLDKNYFVQAYGWGIRFCLPLIVGLGKKRSISHQNQQVAINVATGTDDLIRLHTFDQLAPPAASVTSENPSETFARLGIRSSKDGKAFELDRQLQIAHSSSEINLSKCINQA